MKTGILAIAVLLALCVLGLPGWADTETSRGAVGLTTAAGDARYLKLTGGTLSGAVQFPNGTNESPAIALGVKNGFYLAKAGRIGLAVGGVLITTFDDVTGLNTDAAIITASDLTVNGSTILGDAKGDGLTIAPDTVAYTSTNDITFTCSSDPVWTGQDNFVVESEARINDDLDARGEVFVGASLHTVKGADVASNTTLTIPRDGNYFDITGTTTINHMGKSGWITGARFTLQFDANVTVTHNAGSPPLNTLPFLLQGGVDFNASAGDTVGLVYDGTAFREVSRTVI